jgi:hypothetical protein
MFQHNNYIPQAEAVKVEVHITRPNGEVIRFVCDTFDYLEIEKVNEPEYFPSMMDPYTSVHLPPQVRSLGFVINHPRTWTVYLPTQEQPSIDDGTVVEEG